MTRANINFVYQNNGEAPRTLSLYHNGDQYPTGIRDSFNVLDLVSETITPERFREWVGRNYDDELEDLGKGGQPRVYFDGSGFITDYSYVFEADKVIVWNWADKIFEGSRSEFVEWIKNYSNKEE